MTEIDAVIFDNDGTLVDSEGITLLALGELITELGVEIRHDDADRFMGADLKVVLAEVETRLGAPLPHDFTDRFRDRQSQHIDNGLEPIDGAADVLAALHLPFCVASNAPRSKITLTHERTGLRPHVPDECIVSAYEVGAWKPDPAIFLAAAERLDVHPARCAVVEDSRPGLEGAIAAGMQVFAYDPRSRFGDLAGVTPVASLRDLPFVLLG